MTADFLQRGFKPLFSYPAYNLNVYFKFYVRTFILILNKSLKSRILLTPSIAFIA